MNSPEQEGKKDEDIMIEQNENVDLEIIHYVQEPSVETNQDTPSIFNLFVDNADAGNVDDSNQKLRNTDLLYKLSSEPAPANQELNTMLVKDRCDENENSGFSSSDSAQEEKKDDGYPIEEEKLIKKLIRPSPPVPVKKSIQDKNVIKPKPILLAKPIPKAITKQNPPPKPANREVPTEVPEVTPVTPVVTEPSVSIDVVKDLVYL